MIAVKRVHKPSFHIQLPALQDAEGHDHSSAATSLTVQSLLNQLGSLQKVIAAMASPMESVQENAAGTIWCLGGHSEVQMQLKPLSAVPALLQLACSPSSGVRESVAGALRVLANNKELKAQIVGMGGHSCLINLLKDGSPVARENAAAGLLLLGDAASLASSRDLQVFKSLSSMLSAPSTAERRVASELLKSIFSCWSRPDASMQNQAVPSVLWEEQIVDLGGLIGLVALLESPAAQQFSMECLQLLAASDKYAFDSHTLICASGALPQLVKILSSSQTAAQKAAAGLIESLANTFELRPQLVAAGILKALMPLFTSSDIGLLEAAAQATCELGSCERYWHAFTDATIKQLAEGRVHQHLLAALFMAPALGTIGPHLLVAAIMPALEPPERADMLLQLHAMLHSDVSARRKHAGIVINKIAEAIRSEISCLERPEGLKTTVAQLADPELSVQQAAAQRIRNVSACHILATGLLQAAALPPISAMLQSPVPALQVLAAESICHLLQAADADISEGAIAEFISYGGIGSLTCLLSSPTEAVQIAAACCIQDLSYHCFDDEEHWQVFIEAGGLESLHKLLMSASVQLQSLACDILGWSAVDDHAALLGEKGMQQTILHRVIALLSSPDVTLQNSACDLVCTLIVEKSCTKTIVEKNGIKAFLALLAIDNAGSHQKAALAIKRLCISSSAARACVQQAGGMQVLNALQMSPDTHIRAAARAAVAALAGDASAWP